MSDILHEASFQDSQDAMFGRCMIVSSLALLVYEHVINLEDEVKIWKYHGGLLPFLRLSIGYFNILASIFFVVISSGVGNEIVQPKLDLISSPSCQVSLRIENSVTTILFSLSEVFLAHRLWKLYGQNKYVLYLLYSLLTAQSITLITTVNIYLNGHPAYRHSEFTSVCIPNIEPPLYVNLCGMMLVVTATFLFIMSTLRCLTSVYENGWKIASISTILKRDGVHWFFGVFLVISAHVSFSNLARLSLSGFSAISAATLCCVISSRAFKNLCHHETSSHEDLDDMDVPEFDKFRVVRLKVSDYLSMPSCETNIEQVV